jgi:hypothetical protein
VSLGFWVHLADRFTHRSGDGGATAWTCAVRGRRVRLPYRRRQYVALITAVIPVTSRSYSYGSWNRYIFGYSLAASIVGAFFVPLLLRVFRYEISYAASLMRVRRLDDWTTSQALTSGETRLHTAPIVEVNGKLT